MMTMKAEGRWAWWNQYIPRAMGHTLGACIPHCIERAKEAKLDGVIVKGGYWWVIDQFRTAGIRVGVEVYATPDQPFVAANRLVEGIQRGAEFAIVNAEHEWEQPDSGEQMRQLCEKFRSRSPAELYASVDTRGRRMSLPYQQVLSRYIIGWMPMIYPKAFRPSMPPGFVSAAFLDCIGNKNAIGGKPVLPTIQTYDGIGVTGVTNQLAQCYARGLKGYQAYTIGHATDAEWAVIVNDAPAEEEDMPRWEDRIIVGLDGEPALFKVLQADMTFKEEGLSFGRYVQLMALGFLESTHSHTVKLV